MELLILLLERQGSVVTREEIVDRLWGKDIFVDTEHGINTAIRKVRQALRDDPEQPRFILTISGKGYRFVAEKSSTNGSSTIAAPATVAVVPPQAPATLAADLAPAPKPRSRLASVTALIPSGCGGARRKVVCKKADSPAGWSGGGCNRDRHCR
jgi:DNA-binding winged helix-turn-helix (wHTH) protein